MKSARAALLVIGYWKLDARYWILEAENRRCPQFLDYLLSTPLVKARVDATWPCVYNGAGDRSYPRRLRINAGD
jgi:hypothetical protein